MLYCSTCLYPAPCGRCEDSDNPSARISIRDWPKLIHYPDFCSGGCAMCEDNVCCCGSPQCEEPFNAGYTLTTNKSLVTCPECKFIVDYEQR